MELQLENKVNSHDVNRDICSAGLSKIKKYAHVVCSLCNLWWQQDVLSCSRLDRRRPRQTCWYVVKGTPYGLSGSVAPHRDPRAVPGARRGRHQTPSHAARTPRSAQRARDTQHPSSSRPASAHGSVSGELLLYRGRASCACAPSREEKLRGRGCEPRSIDFGAHRQACLQILIGPCGQATARSLCDCRR